MTGLPPAVQAAYERLLATPPLATADLGLGVLSLPEALEERHLPDILHRLPPLPAAAERVLRLFAADCAEMVLLLFEEEHPGDDRTRRAIEAARGYALGLLTAEELAAARSAARDAAEDAFSTAAGDAAETAAAVVSAAWAAAVVSADWAAVPVVSAAWAVVDSAAWAAANYEALTDNEAWEVLEEAWAACAQLLLRYHRAEAVAGRGRVTLKGEGDFEVTLEVDWAGRRRRGQNHARHGVRRESRRPHARSLRQVPLDGRSDHH